MKTCGDCGERFSDTSPNCPKCGGPALIYKSPEKPVLSKGDFIAISAAVALGTVVIVGVLISHNQPTYQPPAVVSEAESTPSPFGGSEPDEELPASEAPSALVDEPEAPTPEPEGPPIKVSPGKLIWEFDQNQIAGDEKYKGKLVEVSGTVTSIQNGLDNSPFVCVGDSEWDMVNVYCYFSPESKPAIAKLRKGQRIRISGKCRGQIVAGVNLEECSFAK